MNVFKNNIELRAELDKIMKDTDEQGLRKQIESINDLKKCFEHSIKLRKEWKVKYRNKEVFTCYSYAFDIWKSRDVRNIMMKHRRELHPIAGFISYLVKNKMLQGKKWEDRKDGDIIIYFDNGQTEHAGKICGEKVISKWGTVHIWEHDVFEIPKKYGNECKFYLKIEKEMAIRYFLEFAKSKGVII